MAITEDSQLQIERLIKDILILIGENPDREGLQETPKRVAKMYSEIFKGYDKEEKPHITAFRNDSDGVKYDQMIIDSGYFYSFCEHHILPFFGEYFFAYIPDKNILGLSKVARIIDYYSARLQIQERLTKEIADEIENIVKPRGLALLLKARHLCKEIRGVKKVNGFMITSEVRGIFRDEEKVKQEFLKAIKI